MTCKGGNVERFYFLDSHGDIAFIREADYERAATRMRKACVGKVREYLTDCRDEETGIVEAIAIELESLTLDQGEQKEAK